MSRLKIEYYKTDELIPYANNPRNNDDAVDYVANSIREFGFKVPIVIDSNNTVVCGHTRLRAAKKLGIDEIPCIIADDLTEAQIDAFRLADNKTAEIATWDFDKLEMELESLDDFDMSDFGFEVDTPDFSAEGSHKETPSDEQKDANASNFNYKEQYGVIVMCSNEKEQESIYNRLISEGFSCKVVAV